MTVAQELTIVVIDDEDIVRHSLCDQLEDMGYCVVPAEHGAIGIKKIKECHPDLILTDMRMPEMGGLEVIKKSKEIAPDIPIVVVSGAGRLDDAVEALRLGAYDYLVKPIKDFAVLEHVVNKALENRRLIEENRNYQLHLEQQVEDRTQALASANLELTEHKQQLEQTVKVRTQELQESLLHLTKTQAHLVEAEKMASLGGLVKGVAHELNTPLGICITATSLLQTNMQKLNKVFNENKLTPSHLKHFFESAYQAQDMVSAQLNRSTELIQHFKQVVVDVSCAQVTEFNLADQLNTVIDSLISEIELPRCLIIIKGAKDLVIEHDSGAVSKVVENLLINAFQHAFPKQGEGEIIVGISSQNNSVQINVTDNGEGMAADVVDKIFEPFFNNHRSIGGTGLGLFTVYNLVVHSLKGKISCSSDVGKGTRFSINFPLDAR